MTQYHVVALREQTVDEVRKTLRAPGYGHPAHVEVAAGYGPCRVCLQSFRKGEEDRILFTYRDPSSCTRLPAPGTRARDSRQDFVGFP